MEGFDVFTTDDEKVGRVVERRDGFLVVETGHLLTKHKHAIPETFAHADESEGVVRITVSRDLVHDSPKVDGELDELAVSKYYGLVEDDTAGDLSAAEENERLGIESAEERRAEIQTHQKGPSDAAPDANIGHPASQRLERP